MVIDIAKEQAHNICWALTIFLELLFLNPLELEP
jgi:hypothetical protein